MIDSKWLSQIRRGLLELCVLNLLAKESMCGYHIVKRLTSVPGLVTSAGTIYPLLSRLKREGLLASSLVESTQGPARRNYVLTSAGRRHLSKLNDAWQEIAQSVQSMIKESSP